VSPRPTTHETVPTNPNVLERVLFRLNRGLAPVLDPFGATSFEALTLAESAARFDADENGIRILLDSLASRGYVLLFASVVRDTNPVRCEPVWGPSCQLVSLLA
jgi:hypothetical protein